MRKSIMGWVVPTLAFIAVSAVPSDGQSQASQATQMAVELEAEASRLHDQPDRWAYAADLYLAAVRHREDGDPQAQEDLLRAANLSYERSSPDLCVKAEEAPRLRLGCLGDLLFLEE